MRRRNGRTAFTLTELVVLIGLGSILVGLLLPALRKAPRQPLATSCADNLRRIGQAIQSYADAHDGELPYSHRYKSPLSGWATLLLPYLGEGDLYKQYRFDLDWYDPAQRAVVVPAVEGDAVPGRPEPRPENHGTTTASPTPCRRPTTRRFPESRSMWCRRCSRPATRASAPCPWMRRCGSPTSWTASPTPCSSPRGREGRRFGWRGRPRAKSPPNDKSTWSAWNGNFIRGYSPDGKVMPGPCGVNCSNNNAIYGFHQGGAFGLLGDGSVRFLQPGHGRVRRVCPGDARRRRNPLQHRLLTGVGPAGR